MSVSLVFADPTLIQRPGLNRPSCEAGRLVLADGEWGTAFTGALLMIIIIFVVSAGLIALLAWPTQEIR